MTDKKRLTDPIDPVSLIFLAFMLGGTIKGDASALFAEQPQAVSAVTLLFVTIGVAARYIAGAGL